MKYPVYIKEKGSKLIYKAIDFLGMTECYRCIREFDGKEIHLFVGGKYLFSYDKEKWEDAYFNIYVPYDTVVREFHL